MSSPPLDIINPNDVELYCARHVVRLDREEAKEWFTRNLRNYLIRSSDYHSEVRTRGELFQLIFEGSLSHPPQWALDALDRGKIIHLFALEQDSHSETFQALSDLIDVLISWFNAIPDHSPQWSSLSRLSVADALLKARRSPMAQGTAGPGEDFICNPEDCRVFSLEDGWQALELSNAALVTRDGAVMRHCAADYAHLVGNANSRIRIFSLRDPKGRPRLTVEISKCRNRLIARQIKEVANSAPGSSLVAPICSFLRLMGVEDPGVDGQRLGLAGIGGHLFSTPEELLGTKFTKLSAEDWGYLDKKGWSRPVMRTLLSWRDRLSDDQLVDVFEMFTPASPTRVTDDPVASALTSALGFSVANLYLPDALWLMDAEDFWNDCLKKRLDEQRHRIMKSVIERLRSHPGVLHRVWFGPVRDRDALERWIGHDSLGEAFRVQLRRSANAKTARLGGYHGKTAEVWFNALSDGRII